MNVLETTADETSDLLVEPLRSTIVSTPNFRVERFYDPTRSVEPWYEVALGKDHTPAELTAALTFLPHGVRVYDHDVSGNERSYFYDDRTIRIP